MTSMKKFNNKLQGDSMASYEYSDIDEYKSYIVGKAKTKLLYKSNMIDSDNLTAILNDLFTDLRDPLT